MILQMAALGLGDIEDFPFLDPPDRRQVRDGVALLQELGALDARGRADASSAAGSRELPVDPRMGRMVLEADRLGCADEVIVIAAALSIQDPRERPADQRAQADQLHARFADEDSDFLAYLNLWRYLREQQRELSGNQFRKRCLAEYLHYLRIREWQDLVAQLRQAAKGVGVTLNRDAGRAARDPRRAAVRPALARRAARTQRGREYLGARGARFAIFPGSALARTPPSVGDGRRAGRDLAAVGPHGGADRPAWVEPLAGHLVKRTLQRAALGPRARLGRGDRARDAVRPADRRRPHGRLRADRPRRSSRELFIRRALVEGDWETRHAFLAENRRLRRGGRGARGPRAPARHPRRRRGARSTSSTRGSRPTSSRPRTSTAGGATSGARTPTCSRSRASCSSTRRRGRGRRAARPDDVAAGRARAAAVSYRFEPGAAARRRDRRTCRCRRSAQLRADGFEWLVPGAARRSW